MNHYIVNYEIMCGGGAVRWGTMQLERRPDDLAGTAEAIGEHVHRVVHCAEFPDFCPTDVRIVGVFKL